jgi:hypothetical protein|tara:strand:+ start:291 stop:533 length:243 start_codon:yes stop_codon:yes gene_type:complete
MLIIVEHDPNDDWWQDLDPYGEEGPEWDPQAVNDPKREWDADEEQYYLENPDEWPLEPDPDADLDEVPYETLEDEEEDDQ